MRNQEPSQALQSEGVGVCITGLLRSLLHPAVRGSYARRVVTPLRAAGHTVDTFIVLVADWAATTAERTSAVRAAVESAFAPTALVLMQARHVMAGRNGSCSVHGATVTWAHPWDKSRPEPTPRPFLVQHANKTLSQFVAMRECYASVRAHERGRAANYKWLLRTRTDLVFLQSLRLPTDTNVVYIPRDGMNDHPLALCTNDHLFLCPRHLCRPYFQLAELWESPHCRRDARASATHGSAPSVPQIGGKASLPYISLISPLHAATHGSAPLVLPQTGN